MSAVETNSTVCPRCGGPGHAPFGSAPASRDCEFAAVEAERDELLEQVQRLKQGQASMIDPCLCGHPRYQHSDPEIRDDGNPEEYCAIGFCECERFQAHSGCHLIGQNRWHGGLPTTYLCSCGWAGSGLFTWLDHMGALVEVEESAP